MSGDMVPPNPLMRSVDSTNYPTNSSVVCNIQAVHLLLMPISPETESMVMLLEWYLTSLSFILVYIDTSVWMSILSSGCGFIISLGSKLSNPFPSLTFLTFTLLVFLILVIQIRVTLRDLLCPWFVLFLWRCLLLVLWISGQPIYPSLSLLSEDWMDISMALANFSFLWIYLPFSPLEGFLME